MEEDSKNVIRASSKQSTRIQESSSSSSSTLQQQSSLQLTSNKNIQLSTAVEDDKLLASSIYDRNGSEGSLSGRIDELKYSDLGMPGAISLPSSRLSTGLAEMKAEETSTSATQNEALNTADKIVDLKKCEQITEPLKNIAPENFLRTADIVVPEPKNTAAESSDTKVEAKELEDEVIVEVKKEISKSTKTADIKQVIKQPEFNTLAIELKAESPKEEQAITQTIILTTPATPTKEEIEKNILAINKQLAEVNDDPIKVENVDEEDYDEEEEEEVSEDGDEEIKVTRESDGVVQAGLEAILRKPSLTTDVQTKENKISPVAETKPAEQIVSENEKQEDQIKQKTLNNALKEIICDIDTNIKEQENIAVLKQQEEELRRKRQELSREIEQQQLLAKQLAADNEMYQQKQKLQYQYQQQQQQQQHQPQQQQQTYQLKQQPQPYQPPQKNISKYSTFEEKQDENSYTRRTETYKSEESSSSGNTPKRVDLNKIFTPATDAEEILPRNRKLYASSAFYSPTLHPTVEDQVELARRISHSLSDISNQTSKGQSMYVNRKKRSVKWVHEGSGQDSSQKAHEDDCSEDSPKDNKTDLSDGTSSKVSPLAKVPLRLLMNPRGQIIDFNSVRESLNTATGLLSPGKCAELVNALQTQKGRGAELFAKRRKKAEKWVVDENNAGTQSPSGIPDYQQYQSKPPASPSIVPAYSDAGKHRVQLNMHQEQLLEKYAKPGLNMIKTPWEAALETGSASAAFVEGQKLSPYHTPTSNFSPTSTPKHHDIHRGSSPFNVPLTTNVMSSSVTDAGVTDYKPQIQHPILKSNISNTQRALAYKPSIPQGWNSPNMALPKELYVPKEIPLESYAQPADLNQNAVYGHGHTSFPCKAQNEGGFSRGTYAPTSLTSTPTPTTTPIPPKQQFWAPSSYQTVPQPTNQAAPQVIFNPSPLPYDKLAKFENPSLEQQDYKNVNYYSPQRHLLPNTTKVRNTSPTPFNSSNNEPQAAAYAHLSTTYGTAPYNNNTIPAMTIPKPTPRSPILQHSPSRFKSGDLLHGENFNNLARGWGARGASKKLGGFGVDGAHHLQKNSLITTCNLPYTDF